MTEDTIESAGTTWYRMTMARQQLFRTAIKDSVESGVSACFVKFQATDKEVSQLTDLGYDVRVSDSGSTHINWLNL
tara:strand:- start:810 stop:1037 length:228 start_codon:yes stop_codon:yes gene_type:complete